MYDRNKWVLIPGSRCVDLGVDKAGRLNIIDTEQKVLRSTCVPNLQKLKRAARKRKETKLKQKLDELTKAEKDNKT